MAENSRKVAVAIGVGDAGKNFDFLGGAINGAKAFHQWADALGYESRLVTDDKAPVTFEKLRQEIETALIGKAATIGPATSRQDMDDALAKAPPIKRFMLFFAGHGLIREMEEGLWILSNSYQDQRIVAAEKLRRRLHRYRVDQITIIADACRSFTDQVDLNDLTQDGVLGLGPFPRDFAPPTDKFVAAQDGSETYSVPGDSPDQDRCLFSGVLMEGLWGVREGALVSPQTKMVTSESLAKYLRTEVPQLAARYQRKLYPGVSFPSGNNVYFGDVVPAPAAPVFPEWPSAQQLLSQSARRQSASKPGPVGVESFGLDSLLPGAGSISLGSVFEYVRTLGSRPERRSQTRRDSRPEPQPSLSEKLRAQPRPPGFETRSGFAVGGDTISRVWTTPNVFAGEPGAENWFHVGPPDASPLQQPAPLLIEFPDGLFAAATALPRFIGSMLRDKSGVSAIVYRAVQSVEPGFNAASTEDALTKMETGGLRADELTDLAANLRKNKHADPVLGVICAYLYDSIGETDSIRRMAYYYADKGQPIPFDVAMLGHLTAHRTGTVLQTEVPAVSKGEPRTGLEKRYSWTHAATPRATATVGGFWPWMRQGWMLLDDFRREGSEMILAELPDIVGTLTPARFATLDKDGANALARLLKMQVRNPL
jgi:hypothetical protein